MDYVCNHDSFCSSDAIVIYHLNPFAFCFTLSKCLTSLHCNHMTYFIARSNLGLWYLPESYRVSGETTHNSTNSRLRLLAMSKAWTLPSTEGLEPSTPIIILLKVIQITSELLLYRYLLAGFLIYSNKLPHVL